MKKHLDDGQLRSALDGELDARLQSHLDSCSDCQARLHILRSQVNALAHKLVFLAPTELENAPTARASIDRFYSKKLLQKETPMLKKIFSSPIVRFGALAALMLT